MQKQDIDHFKSLRYSAGCFVAEHLLLLRHFVRVDVLMRLEIVLNTLVLFSKPLLRL